MATNLGYKRRVSYYYDHDIGCFHFGAQHPMKPHRLRLTHNLIMGYKVFQKLYLYRPKPSNEKDLSRFHSADYVKFLHMVSPDNMYDKDVQPKLKQYQLVGDCPVFAGLYDFSALSAGGSIASAVKLNHHGADICINWSGGLHHAKKSQASGFCYVNDIVLAILELLKYHSRVLYVDIDVHHGDGVEEAFYSSDRVMTVSFHKYDLMYFPGTGALRDTGTGKGKNYSLNFPLHGGIDDADFEDIFKSVMTKVMESYQPSVVVMQCGADSLAHDPIGVFNLTLRGHAKCVEFMMKWNLPLLLLGGGGYNTKNVARCWTYETATTVGMDLPDDLPYGDYMEYFVPDFKLHIAPSQHRINYNRPEYLQGIKLRMYQRLKEIPHAPGVQMQVTPADAMEVDNDEDDRKNPDVRLSTEDRDRHIAHDGEFSDSEDEDGGRCDHVCFKP